MATPETRPGPIAPTIKSRFFDVPTDEDVCNGSETGEQGNEADQGFLDVLRHANDRWLHQNLSARPGDK